MARIFAALRAAQLWYEDRPLSPDLEGNEEVERLSPVIRGVGWHRSGDIWVASDSEAGRSVLVESIGEWLPKLSKGLVYSRKAYPILVHSVPTPFDMSHSSEDVRDLLEYNTDIITRQSTLLGIKLLNKKRSGMPHKMHGSLVLYLADSNIANACIDCHLSFRGGLLPAVKFVHCPPRCFNCHQTGHLS